MSEPAEPTPPPSGYALLTPPLENPCFTAPPSWAYEDPSGDELKRVALVHESCGALVLWGTADTHEAWHASLTS